MAQLTQVEFSVSKMSDQAVIDRFKSITSQVGHPLQRADFTPVFGGHFTVSPDKLETDPTLQLLLQQSSSLIQTISYVFEGDRTVRIDRAPKAWHDTAKVIPGQETDVARMTKFVATAKSCLGEALSDAGISELLGEDAKKHYGARDHALQKQETMLAEFFRRMEEYSINLTGQFQKKTSDLEQQFTEKRKELEAEFKKRNDGLTAQEDAFKNKLGEFDDRESKHVRRRIRDDLKKVIAERNTKFELTPGTRAMRRNVFWFTLLLLVAFGGTAATLIIIDLKSGAAVEPWRIVRQITFTLAFGCTAIFFIRWNHQWFQRHADEEFKLKRLDLDIDRASWLVEMAMEWKDEKGSEISPALLDRLSRNLFIEDKPTSEDLHPADMLASALFGAAANVTIKTPQGGELSLDRKGIRKLRKSDIDEAT